MIITKKLQIFFKKMSRAHDLYAIMSGAIFESAYERALMSGFLMSALTKKKALERAHMSAITLTRSNDQHL
jgi:hypothetical protein